MACNIKRDSNNNIVRVDAENGRESLLFLALNSNPHLTSDEALTTYKNTFTESFPKVQMDENLEAKLFYKTPQGLITEDFAEALKNTTSGRIEAVSLDLDGNPNFTFLTLDSNTNPDTSGGFINDEIKKGNISGKSVVVDGVKKLQGAGEGVLAKYANAQLTIQNTARNVKLNLDGTLDIAESQTVELSKNDKDFLNFIEKNDIFPTSTPLEREVNTLTQKELTDSLKTFLNRLGVNLTSIEDYIEIYKNKNYAKHIKKVESLKKKFEYIPKNWYITRFIMWIDEGDNYFDARDSIHNFKVKVKKEKWVKEDKEDKNKINLNWLLSQLRHFNLSILLATQKNNKIDKRLIEYCNYELQLKKINFIFNIKYFSGSQEKRIDSDNEYYFLCNSFIFNWYDFNIFLQKILLIINKFLYSRMAYITLLLLSYFYSYWFIVWFFLIFFIKRKKFYLKFNYKFKKLLFNTKFSVNKNIDIYKEGDLFNKLNEFYKEKNNFDFLKINE